MKHVIISLLFLTLSGCAGNNILGTESVGHQNISNLSALRKGMGEIEVIKLMGQPYDFQTFLDEGNRYDVWFYVMTRTTLDQTRMVPPNLTAIAFKNGVVAGWGYNYYEFLVNKYGRQKVKLVPRVTPAPASTRNRPIEQTLDKAAQTPPAPQPTTTQPMAPSMQPTQPTQPVQPTQPAAPPAQITPAQPENEPPIVTPVVQ